MIKIQTQIQEGKYIVTMVTDDPLEFETLKYFAKLAENELEHRNRKKGE